MATDGDLSTYEWRSARKALATNWLTRSCRTVGEVAPAGTRRRPSGLNVLSLRRCNVVIQTIMAPDHHGHPAHRLRVLGFPRAPRRVAGADSTSALDGRDV